MKQNTWLSGEAHLLPNPCSVELLPYFVQYTPYLGLSSWTFAGYDSRGKT